MQSDREKEVIAKCEAWGREKTRALIATGRLAGDKLRIAQAWVDQEDRKYEESIHSEQSATARDANELVRSANALARQANEIARASNSLASDANSLAERANRRATIANAIAIAAAAVTVATIIAPFVWGD